MAEDIESLEFRMHARRNGYKYGPLFVYKPLDAQLISYGMPKYRLRDSVGAIEAFAGLLQNIGEMTKDDPTKKMGKNLPGVNTPEADFEYMAQLSGPMYLYSLDDYVSVSKAIDGMAHQFGWETVTEQGSSAVVFRPNSDGVSADLYSEDPITAASRAMMVSSFGHLEAAAKVRIGRFGAGTDAEYAANVVALEGSGITKTLTAARDAFTANTNKGVALKWHDAGYPLEAYCEGASVQQSVNVVPQSLTVVPTAYVRDGSSGETVYPTRLDIAMALANPYGKLFRTNTEKSSQGGQG